MFDPALYIQILHEDFSKPHEIVVGEPSIWRTRHRWDDYIFNSPLSFHASPELRTQAGAVLNLNPFSQRNGVFTIRPVEIPQDKTNDVRQFLVQHGATPEEAAAVDYATGMISLHDSWGATYGYMEITARMPKGSGHWPALWLAPATKGWPPEIDIIEVAGAKYDPDAPPTYQSAVHFDKISPSGDIFDNPMPEVTGTLISKSDRWFMTEHITPNIDIHSDFAVYGLEWTPDEIIWSIGADSANMTEVFRTQTPADLHSPLYFIANTEVGGQLGGNPPSGGLSNDALEIDDVKIFARADQRQTGSDQDDAIIGGQGFEIITTGDGSDMVEVERSTGNKLITDFSADDRLILTGFDSYELFQTNDDVWIVSPGAPFVPVTIILRDIQIDTIRPDQIERR